ncbi:MAG: HAD family hydrolase [Desulfobacterales bacterium]|nr:HAD family hydrolase [Desulfobacterales bacterium]
MASLSLDRSVIPDVDLVVFDKDGTLIELYHYWSQMVALRARLIREALGLDRDHEAGLRWALGVDEKAGRLRPEGPVGLKKREVVVQAAVDYLAGAGLHETKPACAAAFERADEESSRDLARFVRPTPGAETLVDALHSHGCRVAIATVDISRRAQLAVDFLGFGGKIDLMVGADQVTRAKPAPDMLHLILKTLAIQASRAVMVGDALTDLQMGLNAGLQASIGVLSGLATAEQLRTLTPFVVRDVSEIKVLPIDCLVGQTIIEPLPDERLTTLPPPIPVPNGAAQNLLKEDRET